MRFRVFSIMIALAVCASFPARAEEKQRPAVTPVVASQAAPAAPSTHTLFVVETDEQSALESLNRVSGEIDRGFTYGDDAEPSEDHYRLSPFARQDQHDGR
jgi:hypothetical protein